MTRVTVSREIAAPAAAVFAIVSEVEHLPKNDPAVVRVEFLTDQKTGLGTRFRETRRMVKREMDTELEMTEFVQNEKVRMVAENHGTTWDTLFSLKPTAAGCELVIAMDCRSHKLVPRVMNFLLQGLYRKGMQKHLNALAKRCEMKGQE